MVIEGVLEGLCSWAAYKSRHNKTFAETVWGIIRSQTAMISAMKQKTQTIGGGSSLLKAIVQALFILAVSAGITQAVLFPRWQTQALEPMQRWEVEYLSSGTIELAAEQLNRLLEPERGLYMNQLARDFGFDIVLKSIEEIKLDTDSLARLSRFETVGDPATYSTYKLLAQGRQVLVFDQIKVPAKHLYTEAQRRHMGTMAVIESFLDQSSLSNSAATRALGTRYGYPVTISAVQEVDIPNALMPDLMKGRIVTMATEDSATADYPAEMIYKKTGARVITLGPLSPPTLARFYPIVITYYAILGLFVLLPLALWLIPTWRSMNQLSRATSAFGRGEFTTRAELVRGSKTNYLVTVFNQMASKIQSLVESNKALINSVSHELRTPISRIEFNIELARQSTSIEERNRQLDRIETSVDELKVMVSEMLQYARFDREKPNFLMESVDISVWLKAESEQWKNTAHKLDIQVLVPQSPSHALIERYYMSRAVGNLVRNAIIYAENSIVVSVKLNNDFMEISVSDDGPGVPYQEHTRIFEPFVRLDESRNRDSGGSGLGLAIVKQIVAWHSGDVWVEDSGMGGAKFVIRWPLSGEKKT